MHAIIIINFEKKKQSADANKCTKNTQHAKSEFAGCIGLFVGHVQAHNFMKLKIGIIPLFHLI